MATSLTLSTPNTNNQTSKALQDEAKPAVQFVKSNKGRKPGGKVPYQKKQPQRGMGVAQLERLRTMEERWKKLTETTTQFPSDPVGASYNVPVLHGAASYGVPVMINSGNRGLLGWGDTSGLVMQRVAGNGGFVGLNGQVLVGAPETVQVACGGVVEASKELSSMPKLQHCKPDRCDVCLKKKHCNGENVRLNGGLNQYGQVLPIKGTDLLGLKLENNQNFNEEMNGFTTRAARSAAAYAGHMNINESVEVVAIHRKANSMGTGSVLMEYDFFPGQSSRSTSSEEWEMPAEASVEVGGEASYANASNCVDLSLKLSY